jgi:murein DD-endopeptidase MepM/ murein hydrolase activator NlpD
MTTSYFPQDDDWYAGDWADEADWYDHAPGGQAVPFDVITLGAVALVILLLIGGLGQLALSRPLSEPAPQPRRQETAVDEPAAPAPPLVTAGAEAFILPYNDYILTQGPHGMSYGHYAIDLASGKGEPVLSPINGRVAELYTDNIGNPTLVIANDVYEVTMLHGDYSVALGQEVDIGEQVGTESNKGNTRDMFGNSCRNRDCGYHTHLNVYDKRARQNINPLDLLSDNR